MSTTQNVLSVFTFPMRSFRIWVLLLSLCVALMPCKMLAQLTTGNITGTATDQTGAVIPNAKMTLTNDGTGTSITIHSASTGTYAFEGVNPGSYTLHTSAQGFGDQVNKGIEVHIQQTVPLDITLVPGDVVANVTVVSSGMPLLQSQDAAVGQTIDKKFVDDLPLDGRNWVSLGQLSAGVTTTGGGASGQPQFSANGVNFQQNDYRLNGIDDNLETYGLGGSIAIQSEASVVPIPDAIQEFKIQTGDYSAEFGHSTGAVINAVVKSGTKQFHGDLFEYLRNTVFDANSYFAKQAGEPTSAYHQNQYGGTIGGPVRIPGIWHENRPTFFFFDYQRTSQLTPLESTTTVPTTNMINSGYQNLRDLITDNQSPTPRVDGLGRTIPLGTVLDPATTRQVAAGAVDAITGLTNTTGAAVYVRDPFFTGTSVAGITNFTGLTSQLNMIPAGRLDPNAIKILQLFPSPNLPGFIGNYFQSPTERVTVNQYDIRIDHNLGDNDLLWGVYDVYNIIQFEPGSVPGLATGAGYGVGTSNSPHYAVAISYTHIFSPTLINEFHLGLDKDVDNIIPLNGNTPGIPEQFGIQGVPYYPGNGGLPPIYIQDLNALGISGYNPVNRAIHSIEVSETLTKNHNSHSFKGGYQLTSLQSNLEQPPAGKGNFSFNGGFSDIPNVTSGLNGISDFLLSPIASEVPAGVNNLGGPSSFSASSYAYVDIHRWYMGAFFQDDWKITPKLTLNLGMRWDHITPNKEIDNRQANFVGAGTGNGPGGTFLMSNATCNQATASFVTLLAKDGIKQSCGSSNTQQVYPSINFAPRVGFAFTATPRLVIRGGYGIAYGALDNVGAGGQNAYNFPFVWSYSFSAPNTQTPIQIVPGQTATIENAVASVNLTTPANVNPEGLALVSNQYHYQLPYTQTYNLGIQRQFGNHDSVLVAYVGDVGRHLDNLGTTNDNSEILPPGINNYSYIPFPDFSRGSSYVSTTAQSNYNSLQVTYNHQFSGGLSMLANYTYSKCMTDLQANRDGIQNPRGAEWLPGFGIAGDNQLCPSDATDVVHISGLYQLPFGRGRMWMSNANEVARAVAGGWSVNFIYSHQSGQPFNIPCTKSTTSDFGCNANVIPGANIYGGQHSVEHWVNYAAFINPPVATQIGQTDYSPLGGSGTQARGPGFNNADVSVFKDFSFTPRVYLQFRAEAFNVTNTPQFANPGSAGSDTVAGNGAAPNATNFDVPSSFGKISALINNPRLLQMALKLYF
jgi:hypothetical protein